MAATTRGGLGKSSIAVTRSQRVRQKRPRPNRPNPGFMVLLLGR